MQVFIYRETKRKEGKMPVSQENFEKTVNKFKEIENTRSQFYALALNLLNQGYENEAYILILATWNFAGFRYILKEFNFKKFKEMMRKINPIFDSLKEENFKDSDFENSFLCKKIKEIYKKLKGLKGVKQTGATKIMHLKNPHLFVMWDTKIRKMYKIWNTEPEDYILFLKKMKDEFKNIVWEGREQTFAKAIDEYNYVKSQQFGLRLKK